MNDTLAVIGAGNMGEAIIAGMLAAGRIDAKRVVCADQSPQRLAVMTSRYGVQSAPTIDAIRTAEVVLLAVKPQNLTEVLDETAAAFRDGQTVVTIVAGIPTQIYSEAIPAAVSVVRAMPNTPAQLGVGVTALAKGNGATDASMRAAQEIFASVGAVVEVDEKDLDAVTAVSGSGPAYVFLFAEALIDAGIAAGLDAKTARLLAIETLYGSGVMLRDAGRDPSELREMVSSPGGTTVAALTSFANDGFREMVAGAVAAAKRRAEELATETK
ncbi:MAG: pyrroline-5-carboxylate reductase [Nitriliruptoraceae bacterium]